MNERILKIRQVNGLTQQKFAEKIGLTRNFVWMIEKGERIPSDRTISDICRVFDINEEWLRTGNGLMQKPKKKEDELGEALAQIIKDDDPVIRSILIAYAKMNDDDRKAIKRMAESILKELQELKEE